MMILSGLHPLGWYGREKPAAGGISGGVPSFSMGWDISPVDGNGMGLKLLCVMVGWDGKFLVLGRDGMGNL